MNPTPQPAQTQATVQAMDQSTLWNTIGGAAWVELQPLIDRMFQPLADLLIADLQTRQPDAARILDIGCGAGATTLAAARALGENGAATGLDISEPLVAAARTRAVAENTEAAFLCADAQTYAFEPATFDRIQSRFGVMFFSDFVAAFGNLRSALRPGGECALLAWRSPQDNPFMTTAERAAAPLLPAMPPRDPEAPGQFAFADRDRVARILQDSGWSEIDIQPLDFACTLPAARLPDFFTRLGPLAQVLPGIAPDERRRIIDAVRPAFDPFVHPKAVINDPVNGDEARYTAACWMIRARNPE